MGSGILDVVFTYFKIYGYYILFFGLLLENVVFLGLIVPGETIHRKIWGTLFLSRVGASGKLNSISISTEERPYLSGVLPPISGCLSLLSRELQE